MGVARKSLGHSRSSSIQCNPAAAQSRIIITRRRAGVRSPARRLAFQSQVAAASSRRLEAAAGSRRYNSVMDKITPLLKPCVFLDRDGTLNVDRSFLTSPEQMLLLPGVSDALRLLKEAG